MLISYQQRVRLLLGDEQFKWLRDGDLTDYINEARNQVAAEGECIRLQAALDLSSGVQGYSFANFATPLPSAPQLLTIRSGTILGEPLDIRAWEWFSAYYLGKLDTGIPTIMAQQGQGLNGTVSFYPIPGAAIPTSFDVVALPEPLIDDSTPEAIPYPWTPAIPFYAAWIAMITHPNPQSKPEEMFSRYEQIMMRLARLGATPSELPASMPMDRGVMAKA